MFVHFLGTLLALTNLVHTRLITGASSKGKEPEVFSELLWTEILLRIAVPHALGFFVF